MGIDQRSGLRSGRAAGHRCPQPRSDGVDSPNRGTTVDGERLAGYVVRRIADEKQDDADQKQALCGNYNATPTRLAVLAGIRRQFLRPARTGAPEATAGAVKAPQPWQTSWSRRRSEICSTK